MVESYFQTFNLMITITNKGVYQDYTNLYYILLTVNNVKPSQLSTKVKVCGDFVVSKIVYLPSWTTSMQSIVSHPMLQYSLFNNATPLLYLFVLPNFCSRGPSMFA